MTEIATLVSQLQSEQQQARAEAAEQLCQLSEAAQPAALQLVRATGDAESVSTWAVAALEELGPPATQDSPELAELANDPHELVAYWAVTLLGRLGSDAHNAEPALVSALTSSSHMSVRQRAAWALSKTGTLSAAAQQVLQQASNDSDRRLAQLAAQALSDTNGG